MRDGVRACGPVDSVGIDTWGVDYGLLDASGRLVGAPFSYRDERTAGYADVAGGLDLFGITGVAVQPFNTVFQLAAHRRDELARARRLLMLPELLVYSLTGAVVGEYSSAGTTGLLDLASRSWSSAICDAIEVDVGMLPSLASAGDPAGTWSGIPVHLVGGHDTASAVIGGLSGASGIAAPGLAFISAGTWLLVGREQDAPLFDGPPGFSNEVGALGGIRYLRNVTGFWVLERCVAEWGAATDSVDGLLSAAASLPPPGRAVDLTDPAFLNPDDMVGTFCAAAGLRRSASPSVVTRAIVESMAATCAAMLDLLGGITEVAVFGGGVRAALVWSRLSSLSGLPVHLGPVEATALGNALVQGIALGVFPSLEEARASVG
jgi:rhamnulokinase